MIVWRAGMRAVCVKRGDWRFIGDGSPTTGPEISVVAGVFWPDPGWCWLTLVGFERGFLADCFRPAVEGDAEIAALRAIVAAPGGGSEPDETAPPRVSPETVEASA